MTRTGVESRGCRKGRRDTRSRELADVARPQHSQLIHVSFRAGKTEATFPRLTLHGSQLDEGGKRRKQLELGAS
jgi:hypothetical protein